MAAWMAGGGGAALRGVALSQRAPSERVQRGASRAAPAPARAADGDDSFRGGGRGPRTDGWAELRRSLDTGGEAPAATTPRQRAPARRDSDGDDETGRGGYEGGGRDGESEMSRARRSLTWDEKGSYITPDDGGDAPRMQRRVPNAQVRPPRPLPRSSAGGGAFGSRPPRRAPDGARETGAGAARGGDSRLGRPGDLNLSGAARRVREKALREAGLGMSGEPLPRSSSSSSSSSSVSGSSSAPPRTRSSTPAAAPPYKQRGSAGAAPPKPLKPWERPAYPKPWERPEAIAATAAAVAAEAAEPPLALPSNPSHPNPFVRLGLSRAAGAALAEAGLAEPTPIQQLAIPKLLSGASAAVLAETGSGKTLTYCLPLLTRLYARATSRKGLRRTPGCACPEVLLLVPSRELGVQVAAAAEAAAVWCAPENVAAPAVVLELLGKDKHAVKLAAKPPPRRDFTSAATHAEAVAAAAAAGTRQPRKPKAGAPKLDAPDAAARAAFQSADVIVATPRSLLDLVRADRVRLDRLRAIVVDEADEMLAPGFEEDVRALLMASAGGNGTGPVGQDVQVVFAAATMGRAEWDGRVRGAFRGSLERVASPGLHRAAPGVQQRVVAVTGDDARAAALLAALAEEGDDAAGVAPGLPALVFANSPEEADAITALLVEEGLPAAAFHGRVRGARGELLDELQAGLLAVLVATDVAARGLDLPQLRHVIQWRPAPTPALHLHRVGRTGRAGAPGPCAATTLFDADDAADAASETAPMLAAAAADGFAALGELLDTRRRQDAAAP